MTGDGEYQPPGQVVLGEHPLGQVLPAAQGQVAGPDQPVGLGQAHGRVVEQHAEQRPLPVGELQLLDAVRVDDGGQPAAQAEPARQVHPGLGPGEDPGDGAQVGQVDGGHRARLGRSQAALGRPGADAQLADLAQRADPREPVGEPVRLDQGTEGGPRDRVDPVGDAAVGGRRGRVAVRYPRRRGEQHRGADLLQVPFGDHRLAVPGEDDLALLGDLERPVDRTRRLGQHGAAGRPAAAAERAAPAVEQGQPDLVGGGPFGQLGLRVEQPQGGAGRPELLGRVGVAEHRLKLTAVGGQPPGDRRDREHGGQHIRRVGQVRRALEQRHHVELGHPAVGHRVAGELVDRGDVVGRAGEAHHVPPAGIRPVPVLDPGHRAERGQHLLGFRRPAPAVQGAVVDAGGPGGPQLGQRPGVHLAVLPDLQAGQVETERLRLPDEVLQLAERLLGRAGGGQRRLHHPQVGQALRGARVGQVGVPLPGGGQPLRHVQQVGPVGLLGCSCDDLGQQFRVRGRGRGQRAAQPGGRWRQRLVQGQRPADPGRGGLKRAQRVLGLDRGRLPGDLRGDERVAVPVRADPAAEPEEGRQRRRSLAAGLAGQRPVKLPVHHWDDLEQRLVERGHHRADLVDRVHRLDPQL